MPPGSTWQPGDLVIRETDTIHGYRAHAHEPLVFAIVQEVGLEIVRDAPAKA
jgi:quercetin dioxygenase-like cupin family protein